MNCWLLLCWPRKISLVKRLSSMAYFFAASAFILPSNTSYMHGTCNRQWYTFVKINEYVQVSQYKLFSPVFFLFLWLSCFSIIWFCLFVWLCLVIAFLFFFPLASTRHTLVVTVSQFLSFSTYQNRTWLLPCWYIDWGEHIRRGHYFAVLWFEVYQLQRMAEIKEICRLIKFS